MDDKKKIQEAIVQEHGVSDNALEGVAGGCSDEPTHCPAYIADINGNWIGGGCQSSNISYTWQNTAEFFKHEPGKITWWHATCNNCGLEWTHWHLKGALRDGDIIGHVDSANYSPSN